MVWTILLSSLRFSLCLFTFQLSPSISTPPVLLLPQIKVHRVTVFISPSIRTIKMLKRVNRYVCVVRSLRQKISIIRGFTTGHELTWNVRMVDVIWKSIAICRFYTPIANWIKAYTNARHWIARPLLPLPVRKRESTFTVSPFIEVFQNIRLYEHTHTHTHRRRRCRIIHSTKSVAMNLILLTKLNQMVLSSVQCGQDVWTKLAMVLQTVRKIWL